MPQRSFFSRLIRLLTRAFLWLTVIFLLVNVVLQIPPIQQFFINKISTAASETSGTKVEIKRFYLGFLNHLVIQGVFVQDYEGDTLLYANKIKARVIPNPLSLFSSSLTIRDLSVSDAQFNMRRLRKGHRMNVDVFFSRLFPPSVEEDTLPPKPFKIRLRRLNLDRVSFLQYDGLKGKRIVMSLQQGNIKFSDVVLPNQITVSSAILRSPIVRIEEYPEAPHYQEIAADLYGDEPEADEGDTSDFKLVINSFSLRKGKFSLHNYFRSPIKETPADELDYDHMEVFDIDIDIENFSLADEIFKGAVSRLSLRDSSGFVLNRLSVDEAIVSSKGVELNCFELVTPYTYLGDSLALRYREYTAFETFIDDVRIDGRIHDSFVALRDIMVFAPGLKTNPFFSSNKDASFRVEGQVKGQVNNLRGRDLLIRLDDGSVLKGDFSSRNLAVSNEELINLRLEQLTTNMRTLRELIPRFTPPDNFDRLGRLNFKGSFDGFFADFVAYGDLNTDIGRAVMDMRMNLKQGRERANYSGKLSLINFNLGKWADDANFGVVNFTTEVKNGVGLTSATANADLAAKIQSFIFKGYNYQNASLTGRLNKSLFDGDFSIRDDNIDFSFKGTLNFSDSVPMYAFKALVNKVDLKSLNLIDEDIQVAGDVELNLRSLQKGEADGDARVTNLVLTHNQEDSYDIDSIVVTSLLDIAGNRSLRINSDVMEANIFGRYKIGQIHKYFLDYISRNHNGFAKRLKIPQAKPLAPNAKAEFFAFDMTIFDSKGLNWLADGKLDRFKDVRLNGFVDSRSDSLSFDLDVPRLKYNNIVLADMALIFTGRKNFSSTSIIIDSTYLNDKPLLPTLTVLSQIESDTVMFGLNYLEPSFGLLDNLNLNGAFYLKDSSRYEVRFDQSDLIIFNDLWYINQENYITFGKQFFDTKNFILQHDDRRIMLEKAGDKGMLLRLFNFNFDFIDQYWDYDKLNFAGRYNANVTIEDIFNLHNIRADIRSDTLYINDDDFGSCRLNAFIPSLKGRAQARLELQRDTSQLIATAFYNLDDLVALSGSRIPSDQREGYFDLGVKISGYPLSMARYFIGSTVSNIQGYFMSDLHFFGPFKEMNVEGSINAFDGAFTVDYLKTRYSFKQSFITADNYLFNATGTLLRDKYNHTATIYGGLSHNHLSDLGVKARLRTNRFLALDTKKGDNKLFYGHALGNGEVRFNGPFDQIDIYVNAEVGDSSKLVIPISSDREASELKLDFVNKHLQAKNAQNKGETGSELEGVSLEMDLSIRDEAQMELVFNEQTGDIIRGQGRGDIRILVPRSGNFQMFGDYNISEGNYLFTLYNVINKDFRIKRGGRILWSGDPFGARIQLEAEYKDLKTSVANFVQEYLINAEYQLKNDASKATQVDLTLLLEGELLRPQINFDIRFPQLTGQLQTYTESKLRLLKQDQNELNRQVFGLIVVGQFLPSDLSFQGSEIIYNTVSEFVSNQLSMLLTELFSEAVGESSVFSGLDLDIAYNQYRSVNLGEGQDISGGDEFQLTVRQNFLNDRLSVQVGGNVDFGNNIRTAPEASGTFIGNDVVIEYILNSNRTLKLRIFQTLQPDIGGGRRLEVGTGLSYRKEFNSFKEFWDSFRGSAKKLRIK